MNFFPPNLTNERQLFIRKQFPTPLALTFARLQNTMDAQEPIEAVLHLRDAFECAIRFTACLSIAGLLNIGKRPEQEASIVALLMKPTGLNLGDWHTLMEMSLKAPGPNDPITLGGRLLEGLRGLFFTSSGRRSPLNRQIDGDAASFVTWRNEVFAHGVFAQEKIWYAEETSRWLRVLEGFYDAIRPVLSVWRMVNLTTQGNEIIWHGGGDNLQVSQHRHEPDGQPVTMAFVSEEGMVQLAPLLSVQRCRICGTPSIFLFDRNFFNSSKTVHKTQFLEYHRGHRNDQTNWEEIYRMSARLPPQFRWERTSYDSSELEKEERMLSATFKSEYLPPEHLLKEVWAAMEGRSKGYIQLVGPEGMGKTYLVRGLECNGGDHGEAVLAYYIRPGVTLDYRTFLVELSARARQLFQFRTQEPQARNQDAKELQRAFVQFLTEVMQSNRLDRLIIAIDAVDELPEPQDGSVSITGLLPAANTLPDGCWIVLTSRDDLSAGVDADIRRVRSQSFKSFTRLRMHPGDPANRGLIRGYVNMKLPPHMQDPALVETVLVPR